MKKEEQENEYEPPKITFIGNMNDLLAGSGSQDIDASPNCAATVGQMPNPRCE